jgi:hypothetical protein
MAGVGDGGFCLKNPNPQDISTTEPAHMDKAPERKKGFFIKPIIKPKGRNGALNLLSSSAP